jgi:glycosyltransferase involved in cell wall biosynthesis
MTGERACRRPDLVNGRPRVPVASVIVPARNAGATIGRTLDALADQDFKHPFEVIVVDDGSSDSTAEIAERAPHVSVVRQAGAGAASARNRGVEASTGRLLAFTDSDCVPQPAWLREGIATLERADLVQGRVAADPASRLGPFDRAVFVDGENGLYESANLFVRRSLFDQLGGFEDWLGAPGRPMGEDLWFGWRARRAGARTAFCDSALVYHAVFPRGPVAYAAERHRLVHFPAIAAKVPELRERFFFRRWFLNRRSAAFDAAVIGAIAARLSRSPLPLGAAIPYLRLAAQRARPWGRSAVGVALADLAGDAIGLFALAAGSIRHRSPLL